MNAIVKPPLNQGQKAASEGFFAFLFSEGSEMIISGPAGVGKTFLMGHLIDVIMPRYYDTCKLMGIDPEYFQVEMTATTNKAAETLMLDTGRPCSTIHSFMSLKVTDDYTTGRSKITKTTAWTVHQNIILFVDECSMIDSELLLAIHEGTMNCKIVYVGDHCQMAPVMESLSPIYKMGLPFYELTEPMRTKVPELQALNQQLRNTVETGIFQPVRIVPGIIDLLTPSQMEAEINSVFASQNHDSRILAYTNSKVVTYNDFIREVRQLPDEFVTGERLVNTSAIQLKARMLKVEEEITILSQSADIEDMVIAPDVSLKVRRTDLQSKLGEIFRDIPLPVDRNHFSELLKYYKREKNWNRYFFLTNKIPDLRQRDGATVYKSQGSTLETVYIDAANISTCHNPNQAARMLYVGPSRARSRVAYYGELAQKYGGFIH